jgi:uncharacterized protein
LDARGWGESTSEPRAFESPDRKIRDLHNAAVFLATLDGIDPERTGAVGVCAGAGYIAHAAAQGAPLKSLVFVASWLHDAESIAPFYGGAEGVARRIEAGRAAAERYRTTGEVAYVPAYDPEDPEAAMFFELDYYASPQRGRVDAWDNRFAVMSWPEWLEFDALAVADRVTAPTLMVHSDDAALPDNARRFFGALVGPKALHWTPGAHTDFTAGPTHARRAARLAAEHPHETLGSRATARAGERTPGGRDQGRNGAADRAGDDTDGDGDRGRLADRAAIADRVTGFLLAVDDRDWTAVQRALTDTVRTDYTSLVGGEPQEQSAEELDAAWRGLLPGFDGTQHMIGPVLAQAAGERAEARCTVTATHRLGNDDWTVGGTYDLALTHRDGTWRIASITLNTRFVQGDTSLPERAAARAAEAVAAETAVARGS